MMFLKALAEYYRNLYAIDPVWTVISTALGIVAAVVWICVLFAVFATDCGMKPWPRSSKR